MEDGVVFRHSETDFLLTAARPNLGWFSDLRGRLRVELEDVSDDYGILAVQGPRSRAVLSALMPEAESLAVLRATRQPSSARARSRCPAPATPVTSASRSPSRPTTPSTCSTPILDAGRGHGIRPFGEEALMMLRIEAGLPLVDVEWHNSRLAFTDHQRVTPNELGMGWMLRGVADDDRRSSVGARSGASCAKDLALGHRRHRRRLAGLGLAAPRRRPAATQGRAPAALRVGAATTPTTAAAQVGYVTSFMYSPVLQRHIGLARVRPDLAAPGHRGAHGARHQPPQHDGAGHDDRELPLFNPPRKTAKA